MREEFSKRTKLEAFTRANGRCEKCSARLSPGNIEYHHAKEAAFEGPATLENCTVLCKTCHREITNQRAAVIAKSNRVRAKHLGIRPQRPSFQTNRNAAFKKRMDGTVVRRDA